MNGLGLFEIKVKTLLCHNVEYKIIFNPLGLAICCSIFTIILFISHETSNLINTRSLTYSHRGRPLSIYCLLWQYGLWIRLNRSVNPNARMVILLFRCFSLLMLQSFKCHVET